MASTRSQRSKSRRARRRKRRITGFILFLVFAIIVVLLVWLIKSTVGFISAKIDDSNYEPVPTVTTTYPTLKADAVDPSVTVGHVVLYDATHDKVLYARTPDEVCYPASLTKILTAYVACQYCTEKNTFTIGTEQEMVVWDASRAYLEEGKAYTLKEVLQGLLLPSGADAAYLLATNVPRIHENNPNLSDKDALDIFVQYMNTTAKSLGCTNSNFITPDGYHDMYHYTTASDMLCITKAAMEKPLIKEIVCSSSAGQWENTNALLQSNDPNYYPYAIGIKTGFTDEAGYNLAACAERNGVTLYTILIGGPGPDDRFTNSKNLFELGFDLAENPPTTTTTFHDYFDYFQVERKK